MLSRFQFSPSSHCVPGLFRSLTQLLSTQLFYFIILIRWKCARSSAAAETVRVVSHYAVQRQHQLKARMRLPISE